MSKRSQMTVFAIIGLLLVLSGSLVYYLKGITVEPVLLDDNEMDEISLFVSECLYEVGADAVTRVGFGAGYITPETDSKLISDLDPFSSDSLSLFGGNMVLPYWLYQNDIGIDKSRMPPLEDDGFSDDSIQNQIETYVERNINTCLRDFKDFNDRGVGVETPEDPDVVVSFTDSKVLFTLNYPVEINKNKTVVKHTTFKSEVSVRLKRVYELAKEVAEHELENVFMEKILQDLIVSYSRVDSDYLPPMYGGMELTSCADREMWLTMDVKENMRDMLMGNIPYIKVRNSDFERIIFTEEDYADDKERAMAQGVMDRFSVIVSNKTYPYIKSDFTFMGDFPLEVDFGGAGVLEPKSYEVNMFVANYCFFEYKFYYNVKFPVLVTLYDAKSKVKGKDGFMFQFPMVVVMKDNFPRMRVGDFKTSSAPKKEPSYQCHENQRISGDVTVNVVDDMNNPIRNAYVQFNCGPEYVETYDDNGTLINMTQFAKKCFIGKTGHDGVLKTKLPPCLGGGVLTVKAQDHVEMTSIIGDIIENETYNFSYVLNRVVDVPVAVTKLFVEAPIPEGIKIEDMSASITEDGNGNIVTCTPSNDLLPVQANENVLIRLKKLDEENGILDVQPVALYTPINSTYLKLAPGEYYADLMLIRNERYPGEMTYRRNSQSRTTPGGMGAQSETTFYPEEDVVVPSIISGGTQVFFNITKQQLYNANQVRFYVIDEGRPRFIENIGRAMKDREDCTSLNYDVMRPRAE